MIHFPTFYKSSSEFYSAEFGEPDIKFTQFREINFFKLTAETWYGLKSFQI